MKSKLLVPILIFTILGACKPDHHTPFVPVSFPDSPVNMVDINSAFDDYNSTSPFIGSTTPFCFSSNRNSSGYNFDICHTLLDVYGSTTDSKLTVAESPVNYLAGVDIENHNLTCYVYDQYIGRRIRTLFNISGNNKNKRQYKLGWGISELYTVMANNESGNLDIKYVQSLDQEKPYTSPRPVTFLNSSKDDAYPSLMPYNTAVYFCSNRDGNFDIYKADLDSSKDLLSNFSDSASKVITKDTVLSSSGDDKCPYIYNNVMVFTSNRPGGYGGFDLYYSLFTNGKWSAPVNFGPPINTPNDEYRTLIQPIFGFTNDLMIFSSNRPGGKGGFDLYYVGVKSMIK